MVKNQKGLVTIALAGLVALCVCVGALIMQVPMVKGVLGFKDQKVVNTSTVEPVWLKTPDGTQYLATKQVVANDSAVPVKQSLVTTLMGWVIFLGVLCFFFPAVGIFLVAREKAATKQIVHGIEEAKQYLTPTAVAALETNLSKKADLATKSLVRSIKADLLKNGDVKTQVVSTPPVIQTTIAASVPSANTAV